MTTGSLSDRVLAGDPRAIARAISLIEDESPAAADLEAARANFARLMPATAERVVNFWKSRPAA